jgi:hypothetical protein
MTKVAELGCLPLWIHINAMSHQESLFQILDLFDQVSTPSTPLEKPARAKPCVPDVASLSDAQLSTLLGGLIEELQRRLAQGRGHCPELRASVDQAISSLERLVPTPREQDRSQKSMKTSSSLQEGQRKAVRAALLAGVTPAQVAKHFGLPLAAVRKVLSEAA